VRQVGQLPRIINPICITYYVGLLT